MNSNKIISCIIVDDEIASQKVLQHFIAKTDVLKLNKTCNNSTEALNYLLTNDVDLIFLDINMPQQTGLDFYKSLISPPAVIFTTAYPQYAVDGFEVNATDYLLKPIAEHRFLAAIDKVIKANTITQNHNFIVVKENKALHKIDLNSIVFVEAFGDYVRVHLDNKFLTTHSTFTAFIAQLPDNFIRVHKSFCVNMDKITTLSGNRIILQMSKIPIGQTYKNDVLKALNL